MMQAMLNFLFLCLFELLSPLVGWLQKMIDASRAGGPPEKIGEPRPVVLVRVFIDVRAVLLALPVQRRMEPISLRLQESERSMDMDVFSTGLRRTMESGLFSPAPGNFTETVVLPRPREDLLRDEVEDGLILPYFRGDAESWDYETVPYDYAA